MFPVITALFLYSYAYLIIYFFFFNDTATTEIYTLSLHDALPIWSLSSEGDRPVAAAYPNLPPIGHLRPGMTRAHHSDRKSTRLNSSHSQISYAVFCLKKKKREIN